MGGVFFQRCRAGCLVRAILVGPQEVLEGIVAEALLGETGVCLRSMEERFVCS